MPASSHEILDEIRRSFTKNTDAICERFAKRLKRRPAPETIYHYTDGHGLKGILESGKLWLTDIFALNDPSELRHGIDNAISSLDSVAANGARELKVFSQAFAQAFRSNPVFAHFFVCCFSATGDDLGQWRAYADDGRGYAIGFDTRMLELAFATRSPNRSTFPVKYDDAGLRALHQSLINEVIAPVSAPRKTNLDELDDEAIRNHMRRLSVQLAISCVFASLYFKHPAYNNEREYRFLQIQRGNQPIEELKTRSRPYSLIRYIEFDWRTVAGGSLKKIVLGPAADHENASRFAQDCLRQFHQPGTEIAVLRSNIPYRSTKLG